MEFGFSFVKMLCHHSKQSPVSWAQLTTGLSLPHEFVLLIAVFDARLMRLIKPVIHSFIHHARPTYLSRCAEFTGLSVKPEYGGPTTRNATQCLGQLRKERIIVLRLFFVLTTKSCFSEFFSSAQPGGKLSL